MVNNPLSDDGLSVRTADPHRDTLPLWVTILLLVFAGLRLYEVVSGTGVPRLPGKKTVRAADGGMDTDSMTDLLSADVYAKSAFVTTLLQPNSVIRPDVKSLRQALKSAEELQRDSHNAPGAARRVILLRYLVGDPVPLAPGRNDLSPLAAFRDALPRDLPAPDRAAFAAEARLWETVFAGGRLSPKQIAQAARQIQTTPTLRWWKYPALSALYRNQGDISEANRALRDARTRALPSLTLAGLMNLGLFGLGLLGLGLLLALGIRAAQTRSNPSAPRLLPSFWPDLPETLSRDERRLRAGDLLGVFVLYLVSRELLGVLVGLVLIPYQTQISQLAAAQRSAVGVVLQTVVYVLSALPPIVALRVMARRRGASLADELGWTARARGVNMLYGVAGYAMALPLMIIISKIGQWVFRHAPSPANPAIPQLINISQFWVQIVMVLLLAVAAPLVEELLFRGVLFNALKLRLAVWPSILLTGFVFGAVHPVGIAGMLPLMVLGSVFAWMAHKRASLVPSITAHALQNLTTALLLLFVLAS